MKLLIKILLFVFVAFVANVKVVGAKIIFTDIPKTTSSFHIEIPKTVSNVDENDWENCCQNEWDLVDYRGWGIVAAQKLLRREQQLSGRLQQVISGQILEG